MMKSMEKKIPKILHVVISMNVGGAEKLVANMVRHESFHDNPPVVCCLDELGELGEQLRSDGYKVFVKGRKPGLDWSLIPWLRGILKQEGVEVVHAHQYTPLFYTVPAAMWAGRPKVVYTEHGRFYPDRKSWKRTLVNPILSLGVDHLVAISEATADAMATYDNFPRKRIQVIHNGIDFSRLNPDYDKSAKRKELGIPEGCKVLGTASRLNEIKNIPMMLRVFKQVSEQMDNVCLVIAGDGPERQKLESLAKDLGIADDVKFIGMRFDMPEIYPLFDVFLLTSFTEGISVTLLEALGSGVPAVVTDVGGNKEIRTNSEDCYLINIDDEITFVNQIKSFLSKISYQNITTVKQHFSMDKMMTSYTEFYSSE